MKKNLLLLAVVLIATAATFSSCCNDDESNIPSEKRKEVKFSSNIATVNTPLRMAGNTWEKDDAIGIYMFEDAATVVVEGMENVEYTTQSNSETGSFNPKGKVIYFPDNGNEVRFMSYYPYKSDVVTNGDVYKVDVSSQTSQPAIDLLYSFNKTALFDKKVVDKKVPLVFNHQLTKVYINVKAGTGLTNDDLGNIEIHLAGLNTKADFNLIDGALDNYSTIANITPRSISAEEGYKVSYEAIVLPETTTPEEAQIVFDLKNGDLFTWNFNTPLNNATKYTYNVTINRSGIVVEATINEWINGGENNIDAE